MGVCESYSPNSTAPAEWLPQGLEESPAQYTPRDPLKVFRV